MGQKINEKVIDHESEGVLVKKDLFFHKKKFLAKFISCFGLKELAVTLSFIFLLSNLLTVLLFNNGDGYDTLKGIIELLISYFSISIGFSFTALIFIIESIKKNNGIESLIDQIAALISFYIINGLSLIVLSIIEILLGDKIPLKNNWLIIFNYTIIEFFLFMIFFNIYIFYKIIKVVYHYTSSELLK